MSRLTADIRISIKNNNTGELHKIELIKPPIDNKKWWLRFDNVNSVKLHEASLTKIITNIGVLLKLMVIE